MNKETKKILEQIKQWVFDNHFHHEGVLGFSINLETGESLDIEDTTQCYDGKYPYVNSKELEKFINKLLENE